MLLGQRRRWMNGTVGAYLYWLVGKGQLEFAMSGLKNARVLQMMWAMQLHQVGGGSNSNILRCYLPSGVWNALMIQFG